MTNRGKIAVGGVAVGLLLWWLTSFWIALLVIVGVPSSRLPDAGPLAAAQAPQGRPEGARPLTLGEPSSGAVASVITRRGAPRCRRGL